MKSYTSVISPGTETFNCYQAILRNKHMLFEFQEAQKRAEIEKKEQAKKMLQRFSRENRVVWVWNSAKKEIVQKYHSFHDCKNNYPAEISYEDLYTY